MSYEAMMTRVKQSEANKVADEAERERQLARRNDYAAGAPAREAAEKAFQQKLEMEKAVDNLMPQLTTTSHMRSIRPSTIDLERQKYIFTKPELQSLYDKDREKFDALSDIPCRYLFAQDRITSEKFLAMDHNEFQKFKQFAPIHHHIMMSKLQASELTRTRNVEYNTEDLAKKLLTALIKTVPNTLHDARSDGQKAADEALVKGLDHNSVMLLLDGNAIDRYRNTNKPTPVAEVLKDMLIKQAGQGLQGAAVRSTEHALPRGESPTPHNKGRM